MGPLSPCGSHWLRLEPFTQIRSRTLWIPNSGFEKGSEMLSLLENKTYQAGIFSLVVQSGTLAAQLEIQILKAF